MMMIKNSMWYKQLESITLDNSIACKTSAVNRWMGLRVAACELWVVWRMECSHCDFFTRSLVQTMHGIYFSQFSALVFLLNIWRLHSMDTANKNSVFFGLFAKRTMTRKMNQWHRVYDECVARLHRERVGDTNLMVYRLIRLFSSCFFCPCVDAVVVFIHPKIVWWQ